MANKKTYDAYKHRRLDRLGGDEGKWKYACWQNSYLGPCDSIEKLAEILSYDDPVNIVLVSKRTRTIDSGEQVCPLSDEELAKLYFSILNKKKQRTVEQTVASN